MAHFPTYFNEGGLMEDGDHNFYRALDAATLDASALKTAKAVLANGEHVAARCAELGADPANVVTLYEPIDREVFHPEGETQGPDGSPRIVTPAGRGLALALQACALAATRHPDLKLVTLGETELVLPAFASAAAKRDDIELARRLRWADFALITDTEQAVGYIGRAFACGTPCIGPNDPAVSEIATHRWDSLLVEPDARTLAGAISQLTEPGLRGRLTAPARTSSELFDAEAIERRRIGIVEFMDRKELPLLSVVLPTYNRAHLLETAIRSVLEQDYPNLELIVVNDGSSDGTKELLDRLDDPRLRVVHQENRGLPRALNAGFEHAKGKYWTWTSDDNTYRPGALRALARELELDPDAGLVYTNMLITTDTGSTRLFIGGPPERLTESCVVGGCFLYRADIAKQVGEYDPEFFLVEDYDYWMRMRRHAGFIWLQRVLYDYGDIAGSLTRTRLLGQQQRRMQLLERELGEQPDWRSRKFSQLCSDASVAKNAGFPLAAWKAAWRATKLYPGRKQGWWAMLRACTPRPLLNTSRAVRGLDAT